MKNLFFTLLIAFGYLTTANAQNENKMWVGGTVGFSSTKVDKTQSTLSYKILPEFGYILNQNLAIGTSLGYSYNKDEQKDANGEKYYDDKYKAFSISPFLRYTFMKGNIGALFIDAGVGYTYANGTTISPQYDYLTNAMYSLERETKNHIFEVGFRPGVYVAVSKKINLLGKFGFIGYQHINRNIKEVPQIEYRDIKEKEKTSTFMANFDMSQLLMGVNILF